jgi:hypothetical protein
MVVKHLEQEKEIELRMISLKKESNTYTLETGLKKESNTYTLETEDLDNYNGIKRDFKIGKYVDILEFYLMGNHPSLPATRKDAIKVLRFFEDNGFDVDIIDPRAISYDDAGL